MKKTSKSAEETGKMAKTILTTLFKKKKNSKATVVGLSGDLGAGKTTFVKAVAKELGIKTRLSSPTFVLIKKYPLKHKDFKFLFHIDAYRFKNEKELLYLGWEEIIGNKEHLVFIEWPENVSKAMPKDAKYIQISHGGENERHFLVK